MKYYINKIFSSILVLCLVATYSSRLLAQDESMNKSDESTVVTKPVKNMFESIWLIDNQTVMVPIKGTFEFDILHRFGTVEKGLEDLVGLYAPSNIRLGFNYTPINNLMVGLGLTKQNMTLDVNGKYAIFQQSQVGGFPVSLTYYINAAIDTRKKENFLNSTDRYSYFHQLLLARKLSEKLSAQAGISMSHFNAVEGYVSSENLIEPKMKNDHLAFTLGGRYKVTDAMAILVNYDQPLTKHTTNNPNPNVAFGLEIATSSHAFQIFMGNYSNLSPQRNNMFNSNNYSDGEYLIGFNITRLWNW